MNRIQDRLSRHGFRIFSTKTNLFPLPPSLRSFLVEVPLPYLNRIPRVSTFSHTTPDTLILRSLKPEVFAPYTCSNFYPIPQTIVIELFSLSLSLSLSLFISLLVSCTVYPRRWFPYPRPRFPFIWPQQSGSLQVHFAPAQQLVSAPKQAPRLLATQTYFHCKATSVLYFSDIYDLTKSTIGHSCHRFSSLDWNRNVTTLLNAKGASAKVSDGGFCQIGSHNCSRTSLQHPFQTHTPLENRSPSRAQPWIYFLPPGLLNPPQVILLPLSPPNFISFLVAWKLLLLSFIVSSTLPYHLRRPHLWLSWLTRSSSHPLISCIQTLLLSLIHISEPTRPY